MEIHSCVKKKTELLKSEVCPFKDRACHWHRERRPCAVSRVHLRQRYKVDTPGGGGSHRLHIDTMYRVSFLVADR